VRLLHLAWYTTVYLAHQTGIRGYCSACDASRWAWTHRRCWARQHAAAARWASDPEVRAVLDRLATQRKDDQ
jgi:hypothetical protein